MEHDAEADGLLDLTVRKRKGHPDSDEDSDDAIQDWSIVASISKRGKKDFEPLICEDESHSLSEYDKNALNAARNMMFSALSKKRGTIVTLNDMDKSTIYINGRNTDDIFMLKARGKFLESVGQIDRNMVCHFGYEEALYLIERGTCLAKLYDRDEVVNAKYQKMLPLSLEAVYSLLIHNQEQLDRYLLYSILKRNGYIVMRHPEFNHVISDTQVIQFEEPKEIPHKKVNKRGLLHGWFGPRIRTKPQLTPSLWTRILVSISTIFAIPLPVKYLCSYFNLFSYLSWQVKPMVGTKEVDEEVKRNPFQKYFITFNVWKPMSKFKKKHPPLPDFQVVVVKAWSEFPHSEDLKYLISRSKTNPKNFHRRINRHTHKFTSISTDWNYNRSINFHNLKYNEHNITFAVMDNGIVNFANLSDCHFADEGPCWRDDWPMWTKISNERRKHRSKNYRRSKRKPKVNKGVSETSH